MRRPPWRAHVIIYAFSSAGQANQRDGQYDATLLHWTVNEGHVQTVEHLLACGAEVGARDGKQ